MLSKFALLCLQVNVLPSCAYVQYRNAIQLSFVVAEQSVNKQIRPIAIILEHYRFVLLNYGCHLPGPGNTAKANQRNEMRRSIYCIYAQIVVEVFVGEKENIRFPLPHAPR